MADRTVKVNLLANVTQYERSVDSAADATDDLRRKAERFDGKRYKAKLDVDVKDADKALKDWARKVDKFRKEEARRDKAAQADKARAEKQALDVSLRRMSNAMKEMKRQQAAEMEASKVRVDTSGAMGDLAQLRNAASQLDRAGASPEVNLQIDKFLLDAKRVENELNRLSAEEATPEADLKADKLHFEIQKIRNEINKLDQEQSKITVTADTSSARQQLDMLNNDLNSLNMKKATPEASMKIEKFKAQAAQIERDINRLDKMEANADVDLATAAARAKLAAINAELRQFDGKTFKATVDVNTKGSHSRIGTLIAALSSITPIAAAVASTGGAAIIGMAGAFTVAAAGAGVVAMAFSGIGTALEAANEYAIDPSTKNLEKLNNTLNQLSASQRNFYNFIQGSLRPALQQLQATAADGLLPGVQKGAEELLRILPEINNVIGRTGQALGQMAASAGESLNDPMWRNWFNFIGNEATTQLVAFAESIGNFVQGFAALQMAFNPFTQDIINGLRGMSQEFTAWAQSLQGTEGFEEFLNYVRTVGPQVMETFGSLAGAIAALVQAGAPLGPFFLQVISTFADLISTVAGIPVVGTALIGLATALGVLNLALRATAGMRAGAASLAAGMASLGGASRTAAPAVTAAGAAGRNAAGGLTAAGAAGRTAATGIAAAGTAGRTAGAGVTSAGTASRTAGGAMTALRGAAGAVARNLPIVGAAALGLAAAYDSMNTSAGEGAQALTDQGAAAAGTRAELAANSQKHAEYVASMGPMMGSVREWITAQLGTETTMEQANAEFERQVALMTPLEAATARQQQAQNQLNDAVRDHGPASQQAAAAQANLAARTADVQMAQELAGLSGQRYFDVLKQNIAAGGEMGAAAQRVAAGLNLADLAAMGATVSINGTGQAVATLPDGKQIILEANGTDATFQINNVNQRLQSLPLNTTVNVGAMTMPAQQALQAIGITVTQLPDGTVEVTAQTEQGRAALAAFVAFGNEQRMNPTLDANSEPGRARLVQLINEANAARGLPAIDANSAPGRAQLDQLVAAMNGARGNAILNANAQPANEQVTGWSHRAEATTGQARFDADPNPAYGQSFRWNADTQQLEPVPAVNANINPATGQSERWNAATQSMEPVPNVDANTAPATGQSNQWNAQTQGLNPVPNVNANTAPARGIVSSFMSWASGLVAWVTVQARKIGFSEGGIIGMANGGVLEQDIIANARGNSLSSSPMFGDKKLRRMPDGGARMVNPNTWRVVGDRMDVPELYAPLDGSGRSLQLIAQGAASFGKSLVDAKALAAISGNRWQTQSASEIPRPVNVAKEMALSGGSGSSTTVHNNVTINNPIAERGSDSVQSRLSRLADLGLFGDD